MQRSNDKKEGAEGSQGNLLLPGPCELEWGVAAVMEVGMVVVGGPPSHHALRRSTCTLFAQAKVIILTIS